MPKTKSEIIFDSLVSKTIWPYFKKRAYKKAGNNLRYYDSSGWGKIVNFQKSIYYSKENIQFTVNTGLYLSEGELFHCNKQSFDKFHESSCMVRKRIGELSNAMKDLWFEIGDDVNEKSLIESLDGYFVDFILPFLDAVNSKQDIIEFFLKGYRSDYITPQLEILFTNGYNELGHELLGNELKRTTNSYLREKLIKIQEKYQN